MITRLTPCVQNNTTICQSRSIERKYKPSNEECLVVNKQNPLTCALW